MSDYYWSRRSVPTASLPALTPKQVQEALALLEKGKKLPEKERWDLPFPMGVFGTLRQGRGNNPLMHCNGTCNGYSRAMMPQFIAQGLSIQHVPKAAAPFEVFFYEPAEWDKMIPSVDGLEGFSPGRSSGHGWGYYRTLAWLHLLPGSFSHDLFHEDASLGQYRDLKLPVDEWSQYTKIPCWVYSSRTQNKESAKNTGSPVIWGAE